MFLIKGQEVFFETARPAIMATGRAEYSDHQTAILLNQRSKRGKYQSLHFVVGKRKKKRSIFWLRYDKTNKSIIWDMWCASCRKSRRQIRGVKNFMVAWISAPANHKLSKVSNHAWSDQHKLSMSLMRADKAKGQPFVCTNCKVPTRHGQVTWGKKSFDMCYTLVKENRAFRKYPAIHELLLSIQHCAFVFVYLHV